MGRKLTPQSFHATLRDFIHDGTRLLVRHIPVLLVKLRRLAELIESLDGYRFFGSSLLIIYDGLDSTRPVDVRIIDFAHCVTRTEMQENLADMRWPPENPDDPDHGYLLGLRTLIDSCERIYAEYQQSQSSSSSSSSSS